MRATLERYVSKDVVREIAENPDSYLQSLGGQRKEMVVLFSDLKGFTSDSERLDPAEMVTLLNEYFREMVEVVFAHSGTLDKFIGDALMATWGGLRPANREEDAQNAVLAALKMKERLAAINERRNAARDYALGFRDWHQLRTGDLRKHRFASANGHDRHRRYRQPRLADRGPDAHLRL